MVIFDTYHTLDNYWTGMVRVCPSEQNLVMNVLIMDSLEITGFLVSVKPQLVPMNVFVSRTRYYNGEQCINTTSHGKVWNVQNEGMFLVSMVMRTRVW